MRTEAIGVSKVKVKRSSIGGWLLALSAVSLLLWACSDGGHGRTTASEPIEQPPSLPPKILDADGNIVCDREFGDPDSSLFVLPYLPGRNIGVLQSYCVVNGSHADRFAIDFSVSFRDTVIASRKGVITRVVESFADDDYTYAHHNYVLVKHRDGSVAFYAHLANQGVLGAVGDTVYQGDLLALSGSSGMPVYEPCLHFEVWYDDSPYDPSNSVPVNFRNSEGPLNQQDGLLGRGAIYLALPFTPSDL